MCFVNENAYFFSFVLYVCEPRFIRVNFDARECGSVCTHVLIV